MITLTINNCLVRGKSIASHQCSIARSFDEICLPIWLLLTMGRGSMTLYVDRGEKTLNNAKNALNTLKQSTRSDLMLNAKKIDLLRLKSHYTRFDSSHSGCPTFTFSDIFRPQYVLKSSAHGVVSRLTTSLRNGWAGVGHSPKARRGCLTDAYCCNFQKWWTCRARRYTIMLILNRNALLRLPVLDNTAA